MQRIEVIHLLPKLERKLIVLLRGLAVEQWEAKALPHWRVKDIAAHLLDSSLRRLSMGRDGYFGEPFTGTNAEELGDFLNGLNADWVKAFRRVSPAVLLEMVEKASREMVKFFQSLDADGKAIFPVTWAGENESANWFDIAREYTERWHHQQQIREAVGQQGILGRELYHPVLETFMRALPVAYEGVEAERGTTVAVKVSGRAGGEWAITKREHWELRVGPVEGAAAEVVIPGDMAWKLFTKGLSPEAARDAVKTKGDERLTGPIGRVKAIVG